MARSATEWRILRALEQGAHTQAELEGKIGSARNTIRAALRALQDEGLVTLISTSDGGPVGTGRPKGLYSLRERDPSTPRAPLGTLRPGHLWVRARGGAAAMDAAEDLLAASELLHPAAWAVQLDGDRRELVVVFDPIFGAEPANALRRALSAIDGVEATSGSVRDVLAADDLEASARRLAALGADPTTVPGY